MYARIYRPACGRYWPLPHHAQRGREIKSVGGVELLRASTAYLFRFRKRRHYFVSVQRQDFLHRIHDSLTTEAENSLRHRTRTSLVASVSCAGNTRGCVHTIIVRFAIMRTVANTMRLNALCVHVWLLVSQCASKSVFTNSWAVEVRGGAKAADEVAQKHGFRNHGQVCIDSRYSDVPLFMIKTCIFLITGREHPKCLPFQACRYRQK